MELIDNTSTTKKNIIVRTETFVKKFDQIMLKKRVRSEMPKCMILQDDF